MIILIMGVAGSGKTTVGRMLAESLQFGFNDADSFHPQENIDKISRGIPLDDADRGPWLKAMAHAIDGWLRNGKNAVLACSALKSAYRHTLLRDPSHMKLVYLKGSRELIRDRLDQRQGHFMKSNLLDSQFATLEEPDNCITVDISAPPEALVQTIRAAIGL